MSTSPREATLFADALAQSAAERPAFLDRACAGDAALRARVEALLAASADAPAFIDQPAATRPVLASEEAPGDNIGRYKLLQKIGEGGCGVVYMAEQEEPVRRRVALKVIKLGMDTKAVVARFEAERQALAMMDHPNIAKVHDAGSTETGRPYFVMELVRGLPITKYCDENKLTPNARLELFIKVCQAVQHAHQKGIIHRDLKPSNILVTVNDGQPTPKIIDFGIAKATQGRLTDATVFTAFEQFIGTPVYMSPEQAEMSSLDIDTRSDIYSLGVLLYELLTGNPPFDPKAFAQAGVDQVRRQIREVDPAKPSARLRTLTDEERTTIARLRSTVPAELSVVLRGDLDWIIMRCLEKDRTRRYDTANGLALDIQRSLRHEPVIARPPSTGYLLRKLIRRHRFGFAAAAGVVAALFVGLAIALWSLVGERAARARAVAAEREQARLRADAVESRSAAEMARDREAKLRVEAEAQELATRRLAYASDMNGVQHALATDNLGRAQELLHRHVPNPGELDLRGWEWRYLWQFCQSDAKEVLQSATETNEVGSIAVSSDGRWAAYGHKSSGRLLLQNLETRETAAIPAGQSLVQVTFSPRAPLLAYTTSETDDGTAGCRAVLRDVAKGETLWAFPLSGIASGIAFSRDGAKLVVSSGRRAATVGPLSTAEIAIWDVATGTQTASWRAGHTERLDVNGGWWFAMNADATAAAVVTEGTELNVIDLATGRTLWKEVATDNRLKCLAFSPDGRVLASGGGYFDATIRLWDAATGESLGACEGQRGWTSGLVFLADGKHLVSSSADQTLRLWDVGTRTRLCVFRGHTTEVHSLAVCPDQRTLISGCKDGSVFAWDLQRESGGSSHGLLEGDSKWGFGDRGRSLIGVSYPRWRVRRWRGPRFREATELLALGGADAERGVSIRTVVIHRTLPLLAVLKDEDRLQVWNWERRELVREWAAGNRGERTLDLCFSDDGRRVLSMAEGGKTDTFREWELADGREVRRVQFPAHGLSGRVWPTFTPDRAEFIIINTPGTAVFRDLSNGTEKSHEFGGLHVRCPGISWDGSRLVLPSAKGYARVFDTRTLAPVVTLRGFMFGVHQVSYSPDMQRLLVGGTGSEALTLWDTKSYERLLTLPAKAPAMSWVEFSPDGDVVVGQTGGTAGQLHLWRAPSWEEIEQAEKAQAANHRNP